MENDEARQAEIIELMSKGVFEEALVQLQAMAEVEPDNPFVVYHLGACLSHTGAVHEAFHCFQRLLALPATAEQKKLAENFLKEYRKIAQDETLVFIEPEVKKAKFGLCEKHHQEAYYLCHRCNQPLCFQCTYPYEQQMFCFACFQKKRKSRLLIPSHAQEEEVQVLPSANQQRAKEALFLMFFVILGSLWLLHKNRVFGELIYPRKVKLEYQLKGRVIPEQSLNALPPNALSQMEIKVKGELPPLEGRFLIFKLVTAFKNGPTHKHYFFFKNSPSRFFQLPVVVEDVPVAFYTVSVRSL